MTTIIRHEPTDECNGRPLPPGNPITGTRPFGVARCSECGQTLCPCEEAYGHDCEA